MQAYDTLWGYCAGDQWLAESTRLHRTSWDYLFSLRNGFTAYFVLFPENGSFASVIGETLPANVAPAPRRPNHTTSPYARAAHVSRSSRVHRISPRVRDDGQRPSSAVRRRSYAGDLRENESRIFLRKGLDRIQVICPVVPVCRSRASRLRLQAKQISSRCVAS